MTKLQKIRAIFFDLDGTFADTAPDLAFSLNAIREEYGLAPLPFAQIRPYVSNGSRELIRLAFNLSPEHADYEKVLQQFLEHYRGNLTTRTELFDGIQKLLESLHSRNICWGIVTNKSSWLTDPLMAQLNITPKSVCVVSGDTTPFRKPHAEPILHACKQAGVAANQCLYVGDAQRDIEAGKNAGVTTLVANYGYIAADQTPHLWGADAMIDSPIEILQWLDDYK